jgi:hypothetical protein
MTDKIIETVGAFLPAILNALGKLLVSITSLDIFSFNEVIAWFKERESLIKSNEDNIAFTLLSERKDKNIEIVIGIFNKKSDQIIEAEKVIARQLDERLSEAHQNHELVVYE